MRKVTLYIAMSLDGYIAKPGDDLSFLQSVQKEGEDYGYGRFVSGVDTVILGRRTFDWVTKYANTFPHQDKETSVITRSPRSSEGKVQFYTGSLASLIHDLKGKNGKTIFVDGGGQLVNALLRDDLIDKFIISVIPIVLGDGVKLFEDKRPEKSLEFVKADSFETGLIQLKYKRK